MTDLGSAEQAFARRCAEVSRQLAGCVGYFVDRVALVAFPEEDSLEVTLREGPTKPDVLISLSNLYSVSISKPPTLSGCFVDEISLVHLPKMPGAWPDEATRRVGRFGGLPDLVWLRIGGPAEVGVTASIVTLYTATSADEGSEER